MRTTVSVGVRLPPGLLDKDGPLDLWLDPMADMAFRDPLRLAGLLLLLLLAASAFLALQLWMIVTPLRVGEDAAAAQQQQERDSKESDALSGYDPYGGTDGEAAQPYGRVRQEVLAGVGRGPLALGCGRRRISRGRVMGLAEGEAAGTGAAGGRRRCRCSSTARG